jgi:UDP-glucose 4-epimerase
MHRERVLVTGAAGFIGSHVAEHCLRLGFDVIVTDDLSGGYRENVLPGAIWVQGDLRREDFVEQLWNSGPIDHVYHIAAYAAEGLSHFIRRYNYETNLGASVNLINQSLIHEVKTFVFTSSIAVYGKNQLPMTEDLSPSPEDPYGISKLAVELDLKAAHDMFGMEYIIFRPHNVYGPRQNIADRYRNVIGIFMSQLLRNEPMTIFGDGLQTRAFSYIDDVAPVIARSPLVKEARNCVFNLGAEEPCTVLRLAEYVASAMEKPCKVVHLDARNEVTHAFSEHSRVKRVFGETQPVGLEEGLKRMAAWVRNSPKLAPITFPTIEVRKRLPASWSA